MQKKDATILYSASDIVSFLDCEHKTTLDLIDLETPLPKAEDDDEAMLYQKKGFEHEGSYVEQLKKKFTSFADISAYKGDIDEASIKTVEAMRSGADIIYQATFIKHPFLGHADFLKKVPHPSSLGDYSYEVIDTKLARNPKARFIIQLCFYSELLRHIQGYDPLLMHVVLGDGTEISFRCADYSKYYATLKERFLKRMQSDYKDTYPEKHDHCDICRWRNICEDQWIKDDHLNQVANISRLQIKKLEKAGVSTLKALAGAKNTAIPKMAPETLSKLCRQASLQLKKRQTGQNYYELLPLDPERKRGFARLPEPDEGDIFFDMESDSMDIEGLEYLFGVYYFDKKKPVFMPIWAHNRNEEKLAFVRFMDFAASRLKRYPKAHIYHYGQYEEAALKKLMSLHGTHEAEVDNLLRFGKLVDLYRVVREGMMISEPAYSLKNVEHFYLSERTGEVKNAGASVVYYDRWKETGDKTFLRNIEDYNKDDVISTYELRQWLLKIRPKELQWADYMESADTQAHDISVRNEKEIRLAEYQRMLTSNLPDDRSRWTKHDHIKELTYQLLDFQRRAAKPVWWSVFSRAEMTPEELIDNVEAIGDMRQDLANPPYMDKKSYVYTYIYPEQETKIKTNDNCVIANTLESINNLTVDEDAFRVTFSYPAKKGELGLRLSIGLGKPINSDSLTAAVYRFADSIIEKSNKYPALEAILYQDTPRIKGHKKGTAIIYEAGDISNIIHAVANLDNSYIFIQGPPGAGKTYTGSHIIAELLKKGKRVGVSSNSHKAINNLLSHVERVASQNGIVFHGVKKSTKEESEFNGRYIHDVFSNEDALSIEWQLVAGTAWLFSDPWADKSFDYLFVDEAGQVALANLIAMGTSAKNIVLLGDQMQLGQPIQGIHPGRSGESSLDYLLNGMATIPPEQGIFLNTTWRMHPDVCKFISDAVYDGRLKPEPSNIKRRLVLSKNAHPALKPAGVVYIPAQHDACSQRSEEEAFIVEEIYKSLLRQHYIDKDGVKNPLTEDNILVVAPYNMQVNLLKKTLHKKARVGTVDKFQGQEAEVVIVSMATSSGDYMPRHIEFLYSKNRLNVALSRAKCLAMLVANPALMSIKCSTIDQMALVNTLCWVRDYSERSD
ncbi:MAG: TM0106 family RecB-like putative nuclease [Syntrophorhabdaceae bacterium]|nr:TM0106 family RecB-like putative nuclease [Syntrophorhabdaceae bacterium]